MTVSTLKPKWPDQRLLLSTEALARVSQRVELISSFLTVLRSHHVWDFRGDTSCHEENQLLKLDPARFSPRLSEPQSPL